MEYLRLRRSQVILASFLAFAVLAISFPAVDISISKLFFDGKTFLRDQWWQKLLQDGLGYFLCLSMLAVISLYGINRLLNLNLFGVCGRKVLFLVLVLVIGPGLIVNLTFKDHFGRARPRDVAEFGGSKHFSPAFTVAGQCGTNCSFSSGDAAGAFFALPLALVLTRRRAAFVAALSLGALVSFSRVAAGAHFFSDTAASFFVMLTLADLLFFYVVLRQPAPLVAAVQLPKPEPAASTEPA